MKRWLSHPPMFISVLLMWLVLQQSLTPGTILVGIVLAVILSRLWGRLDPPVMRLRHVGTLLALWARVCIDIIASNLAVARLIVLRRPHTSGFVTIPLELTRPAALSMLACIITATPGTIWISHDSNHRQLVIHVLDLADEAALIRYIKQRYERALLEVFR